MQEKKVSDFLDNFLSHPFTVEPLTGGGSDRVYSRVHQGKETYILTQSENRKENECFFYFSEVLKGQSIPEVFAISPDRTLYLQSDLGNENLLDFLEKNPSEKEKIYTQIINLLVDFQQNAHKKLDYRRCFEFPKFSEILVLRDLFYFKHYFLDMLPVVYSQYKLLEEFHAFSKAFANDAVQGFCYRDFQGRNIMLHEGKPFFIDYQGGMEGPPVYDLVSLIWQAKAQVSPVLRERLKSLYFSEIQKHTPYTSSQLQSSYDQCVLERLLQVLGAYGKLGLLQGKTHFRESIAYGIQNLSAIQNEDFLMKYPVIQSVIQQICSQPIQTFIQKKLNQ